LNTKKISKSVFENVESLSREGEIPS